MNQQLKTVTIRIAHVANGGVRAWSDDLAKLTLTCSNHAELFALLGPKIESLLRQEGFNGKVVREIHQFVFELEAIDPK